MMNQHYFMAVPGNRSLRKLLDASRNSFHEDCETQPSGGTRNAKTSAEPHASKTTKFMDKYKEIGKKTLNE